MDGMDVDVFSFSLPGYSRKGKKKIQDSHYPNSRSHATGSGGIEGQGRITVYNRWFYRFLDWSFFSLVAPSNTPRSTAAATVNVPPMTAHKPVMKPANVLALSSLLTTFIGEMS